MTATIINTSMPKTKAKPPNSSRALNARTSPHKSTGGSDPCQFKRRSKRAMKRARKKATARKRKAEEGSIRMESESAGRTVVRSPEGNVGSSDNTAKSTSTSTHSSPTPAGPARSCTLSTLTHSQNHPSARVNQCATAGITDKSANGEKRAFKRLTKELLRVTASTWSNIHPLAIDAGGHTDVGTGHEAFPGEWRGKVWQGYTAHARSTLDRLEEYLEAIKERLVHAGHGPVPNLSQSVKWLERYIGYRNAQLQSLHQAVEADENIHQFYKQTVEANQRLEKENGDLKVQIVGIKRKRKEMEAEWRAEVEQTFDAIKVSEERNAELEDQVTVTKREKQELKAEVCKEKYKLAIQVKELENQVEELEREITGKDGLLDDYFQERGRLVRKIAVLEYDRDMALAGTK